MTATPLTEERSRPLLPVFLGGTIAGTLDILFAIWFWAIKADVPATRILQSVASGLLGRASYQGGATTAMLGLALHYLIAITMSLVYFRIARHWMPLWTRPVPFGAAYGLGCYIVMNFVVLPLSGASAGSKDPLWIGLGIAVHMLLIGVPIALCTRRAMLSR